MAGTHDQPMPALNDQAADGALGVGFPLPESNSVASETRTNASPNRESNQVSNMATEPSPATRSRTPQVIEFTDNSQSVMAGFGVCDTELYHISPTDYGLSTDNHSIKSQSTCSTKLTHNRRVRGLWRRGCTYQFRVRVPADLIPVMGCSHDL